jgi:hypothetical protein
MTEIQTRDTEVDLGKPPGIGAVEDYGAHECQAWSGRFVSPRPGPPPLTRGKPRL